MAIPPEALAIARRQAGLVTRGQLVAVGVPPSTVDTWVGRSVLERHARAVYRVAGSPRTADQQIHGALLRAGPDARVGGWSACRLYGLEGFDADRRPPWVVVPRARRIRGVDFVVQQADLDRGDLAVVGGLPTITPVRAVLDLATRVRGRPLRVAIDDARRRGLFVLERLLARAIAMPGHRGAAVVHRLFGSGLLDQDGELERQLALLLADAGLQPAWGMEVLPGIIVDACFPEASYVLECDGMRWHSIDADRASDVTRSGVLVADGWLIDRVRDVDVRDDRLALIAHIRATRAAREAAGLGRAPGWQPVRPGRRVRPPRDA